MDENLGTVIIDGKIINLDKLSMEELIEIEKRLDDKEKQIREEIDKLLEIKEED